MKHRWKALVLAGILILLTSAAFSGCTDDPWPYERQRVYFVVTDSAGNEFNTKEDGGNVVEWEYERRDEPDLRINASAKFWDTDRYVVEEPDWGGISGGIVDISTPGVYEMHAEYTYDYAGSVIVIATVKENRPLPDIQMDGGEDCIESIPNKRFVYKYDGKEHFPSILVSYNGETLRYFSSDDPGSGSAYLFTFEYYNGTEFIPFDETEKRICLDIGLYRCVFSYSRDELPVEYKNTFRDIRCQILIEIV